MYYVNKNLPVNAILKSGKMPHKQTLIGIQAVKSLFFKKQPLILFLLLVTFVHSASAINFFDGSYEQALEKSKAENKNVLLYFTAKWCGPCKVMERDVFHVDSINSLAESRYIPLKIDIDKPKGKRLASEHKTTGYPTFVVLNPALEEIGRHLGGMKASEFYRFLQQPEAEKVSTENINRKYETVKTNNNSVKKRIGLQLSTNLMHMPGDAPLYRPGYSFGAVMSFEKGRLSLQPGLNFISQGGKMSEQEAIRNTYLEVPLRLNYTIRSSAIFGLPGGINIHAAPYSALALSRDQSLIKAWDYGSYLGLSTIMGHQTASMIELTLGYKLGLANISAVPDYRFYNRGYFLSFAFLL